MFVFINGYAFNVALRWRIVQTVQVSPSGTRRGRVIELVKPYSMRHANADRQMQNADRQTDRHDRDTKDLW